MTWLVESPWPILMLGIAAELVLAIYLVRSGRASAIAAMAVVFVITGGLLVVERFVVTETEAVEDTLDAAAAALVANDSAHVLDLFSSDSPRRAEVRSILQRVTVRDAHVGGDLEIRIDNKAQPATASTAFTARIEARDNRGQIPYEHMIRRLTVSLRREGGRWLIHDYADSEVGGPARKAIPRR